MGHHPSLGGLGQCFQLAVRMLVSGMYRVLRSRRPDGKKHQVEQDWLGDDSDGPTAVGWPFPGLIVQPGTI